VKKTKGLFASGNLKGRKVVWQTEGKRRQLISYLLFDFLLGRFLDDGLGAGGGAGAFVLGRLPRLAVRSVEQDADGTVLSDAIAHLARVHPDGQLGRKGGLDDDGGEAAVDGGLFDHGIELAVDPDAPIARPLVRLVGKPVVHVPPTQNVEDGLVELLQLGLG